MKYPTPDLKKLSLRIRGLVVGCLFGGWSLVAGAQARTETHELRVQIAPQFHSAPVVFDKVSLTNAAGQLLTITRLDFLVSSFALHQRDGAWIEQTNWQAFINLRERRSNFEVTGIPAGEYDKIRFHVGLKPELNHSNPAQYPSGHPLNPNLNGLHWGWAGGYIFFAMEGHWQSVPNRFSGYSYHLGNDHMLMTVELPLALAMQDNQVVALALKLDEILGGPMTADNTSTHSREGDEVAIHLRKQIEGAFAVTDIKTAAKAGAATHDKPVLRGTPYRFSFPAPFPIPDLPRDNPLTQEGVALGRELFFDKQLSVNGAQSCASCHQAEAAFTDAGKKFSTGAEGREGQRNAMPIFNLAWKRSFFWDGRAASLREQVLMPIQNPVEMHETLEHVVGKLAQSKTYPALFENVFGDRAITSDRLARALEQFILTQLSFDSKFDRAMMGREKLSDEEQRGLELFFTERDPRRGFFGADCFHCHGGPFFTTHGFSNNGLDYFSTDPGRFNVTTWEPDWGKFSVPSLRNVAVTGPYMHDGRFKSLEEVVEHYSTGVKRSPTLDPNLAKHPDGGVLLSDADKKALVAFLKTLTDSSLKPASANSPQPALSSRR